MGIFHDLRYAFRQLRKTPGFTIVAVVTLTLGIGANTAVFSALNALLLKMLPIHDPQHLYTVTLVNGGTQPPNAGGTGDGNTSFSYPVYRELRQQTRILADLIAHIPLGPAKVPVRYGNTPTEKTGEEVSGNYFAGLGVPMLRGVGFTDADERDHSSMVILSYSFWTEEFSRDPSVLGRTLYIKGVPFTISGITTPSFYGVQPGRSVDFWIPLQNRPELNAWGNPVDTHTLYGSPNWWAVPMVARLRPEISPVQAQQALQTTFWHAASEGVGTLDEKVWPAHLGFEPIRGIAKYVENYRQPVEIMMALVGLVLLIACTNVALLILARNAARRHEFVVRIAVGAQSFRLFRQLLTESLLLVAMGAGLGWIFAVGATRALAAWARIDTGLSPDRSVLLFTLTVASLAALIFSLVPWRTTLQISVEQELKSSRRTMSPNRSRVHSGNVAIAFQIAMCLALLVASGLSVRSLMNYQKQDLGMQAESLLVFDLNPQNILNNAQAALFYERLLDRFKAIPGVSAASLIRTRPGSGWITSSSFVIDGEQINESSGAHSVAYIHMVGPDFFRTLGVPVLQGRDITQADTAAGLKTVVVSETFARRYLKSGALGHHVGESPGAEIVGVAKDSAYANVTEGPQPVMYYPLAQIGMMGQITVEARTTGDPTLLIPAMQRAIHELDPNLPLQKPMTQAAQFAESYVTPNLFARLSLAFGLLAVGLVATGLYGTLAYRVQRRKSEIGIRMALGAQRADVLWMIFRESLLMAALGLALGVPIAFAISRLLRSQLYHLNYLDAVSFSAAIAITLAVTLAAALLPARRAAKVDPMVALRYE